MTTRLTPARNAPPRPDAVRRGRVAQALAVAVLLLAAPAAAQAPQPQPFGPAPTQSFGPAPMQPPAAGFGAAPGPDAQRSALQSYAPQEFALPPWAYPRTIAFEEGDPVLDGYAIRTRPNRALFLSGLITFCVSYGISLIASSVTLTFDGGDNDSDMFAPLLIPFVGPIVSMATASRGTDGAGMFMLGLDAALQTGSLLVVASSLANEDLYLERQGDERARPPVVGSLRPAVSIGPSSASLRWRF